MLPLTYRVMALCLWFCPGHNFYSFWPRVMKLYEHLILPWLSCNKIIITYRVMSLCLFSLSAPQLLQFRASRVTRLHGHIHPDMAEYHVIQFGHVAPLLTELWPFVYFLCLGYNFYSSWPRVTKLYGHIHLAPLVKI